MGKALFILLFAANVSFAQNAILAGRIVDTSDKPVAGAVIKVVMGKKIIETTADKDGLYYTKPFPAGTYAVRIYANSKSYKVHEIPVVPWDKAKKFYNFQLVGNKVVTEIDEQDPFMAVAFNKVETNQHRYDFPVLRRYKRTQYQYEGLIIDVMGVWRINYITDSNKLGEAFDSSSQKNQK